jgi:CRP-like cAMP-binding protein
MVIDRLRRQHIFGFLRPEQVDVLSDAAQVISLKAGDEVYRKGDKAEYFYIVLSGELALRLPGKNGVRIVIDELSEGAMFGTCVSLTLDSYVCSAQCVQDSDLLKIRAAALKKLFNDDPRLGYVIQSRISHFYFKRYVDTMQKLQSIVMNIPIESEE